jgi:acylphosphatase
MKLNYEIFVDGRVQGVGFRYFVINKATGLHLTGTVRNCSDGKVMVVAEGDATDLETLVDYLRMGPPMARVRSVSVSRSPFTGSYKDFNIR